MLVSTACYPQTYDSITFGVSPINSCTCIPKTHDCGCGNTSYNHCNKNNCDYLNPDPYVTLGDGIVVLATVAGLYVLGKKNKQKWTKF